MTVRRRQHGTKDGTGEAWSYDFAVGKRRYRKSGFLKKGDAIEAEAKLKGEVCTNGHRVIRKPNVLFKDLVPEFLATRQATRANTTYRNEEAKLRLITRHLGDRRLSDIALEDIEAYVKTRDVDGVMGRTINIELTLLSVFFRYAIKHKFINHNPARDMERRDGTAEEKWCPSVEEFDRHVEAIGRRKFGWYVRPWVLFRAYSGVRPRESLYLDWADIDLDRDLIHIRRKGEDEERGEEANNLKNRNAIRSIPIHPKLKPILIEWRKTWERFFARWQKLKTHRGEPHTTAVFFSPRHPTKRAKGFYKTLAKIRKETGFEKMDNYTTRHYFISRCMECGIAPFTIAKWVGHKNTRMIEEVYGHLSPKFKHGEMTRLSVESDEPSALPEASQPVVLEDISKVSFGHASPKAS